MTPQRRISAISITLLACLWAGAAAADQYEVRTFLVPSTQTESQYQFGQSCIKGRYVCPVCSFSCNTPPTGGNCPNPWGAAGHGAGVALLDMGARLQQRLLALAPSAMPDAAHADLSLPDAAWLPNAGTDPVPWRAVLGRPFAPTDNGNTRRSTLYAQAAGVVNATAADGPVISTAMHGRFLVVPPTPLRREPATTDGTTTTYNLAGRKITAQAEDPDHGGNQWWVPRVVPANGTSGAGATTTPPPIGLAGFMRVGVNPYRADDGDYWFVRYRETAQVVAGAVLVTAVGIELYSINYGWQGAEDGGGNPIRLDITNGGAQIPFPFSVMADSGAVRITFEPGNDDTTGWSTAASPAGGENIWVCGFMTRSSCRLIPGWRNMRDDTNDWPFPMLDGSYSRPADQPTFAYTTEPMPRRKQCWFAISNGTPSFTTESPIEETGAAIPAAERYVLPPEATGVGTVAVEWAGDTAATGAWDTNTTTPPPNAVYYRNGGEWRYDASYGGTPKNVTNHDVAVGDENYGAGHVPNANHVELMAGRFMSSRVSTQATQQQWRRDGWNTAAPLDPVEPTGVDSAYPRVVLGAYTPEAAAVTQGTFAAAPSGAWLHGGLITGDYASGSSTPARPANLTNRWDGTAEVHACNVCGAVWPPGAVVPAWCPYHAPLITATVDTITIPAPVGLAAYEGVYNRVVGMLINGRPYYQNGAQYLYFRGQWALSQDTNLPFNRAAYRGGTGALPPHLGWSRSPAGGGVDPAPSTLTYAGPGELPNIVSLSPAGGGQYVADRASWREAVAYSPDERANPLGPAVKQMLPPTAIRGSGLTVGHAADWDAGASDSLSAAIPPYQAPSVPGVGVRNDRSSVLNLGYRGGQIYYRNESEPHRSAGLTSGWDAFYRNPDNGYFQPRAGVWPFICPTDLRVYYQAAGGNCPDHAAAVLTEAPGRHYFCPVCGAEYAQIPASDICPFDGRPIAAPGNQIPLTEAVREEHLVAEEYDPFDIQVSVDRHAGIAQSTTALQVGRTAPGVNLYRPDVTVQQAGNLVHRAFPGDVTALPMAAANPFEERIGVRNEGNIALSPRLGNAHDFNNAAVADRGLDHYLRVGVDADAMSYGRKAVSGPLTRDTLMPFNETGAPGALLNVMAQGSGSAAGSPTFGFLSAGSYAGLAPKPVPLGQPAGTYTGRHLQYIDTDGDGAFDFLSGGVATSSAAGQYNPAVDLPLEPLVGVLQGQVRAFETRMPQNDYYALDSDPIVLPSPTPGQMQVMWSTNRAPVAVGDPAPAGTTPANLPNSNAGTNLVYMTTSGVTGGTNDELYRAYNWPVNGTGAITSPIATTSDGSGYTNGMPWAMYSNDGTQRWAFWHRSVRHAGGVESTLRYINSAGVSSFIYDTGLGKQGLRGFALPPKAAGDPAMRAWLFWHGGPAGRERLMYRWDFDGTVSNNEAPVPVTNQAFVGMTQVPNASVQGQTDLSYARDASGVMMAAPIQKPSQSPFTYTKDTSVFHYNGEVNLFFSGFVTSEAQADICWTKYRLASLGPAAATDNYGKIPFAPIPNWEEMRAEGMHQRYSSRHLDWLADGNFAASGPSGASLNPSFILQFAFKDTIGDGVARGQQSFRVDWTGGTYDRARGIYRVTPLLYSLNGSTLPPAFAIGAASPWQIRAPGPGTARPLTMEINIAAGTVQFSSPLFNEDAPGPNPSNAIAPIDRSAVFNSTFLNNASASEYLEDVILRVNYTPYIYRVTRDEAQDDAPSANYDPTAAQRLTVFWRRSFPTTDAPNFGRASFMYKVYTTSVQLARPPVAGNPVFTNHYTGVVVAATGSIPDAGIYNFPAAEIGSFLDVQYNGATGPRERHQVIGWSREMTVPVDTVLGEGAPVAVPESFGVPRAEGDVNNLIPAMRYWLFWSSPRGVYDLRLVENNGTRVAPGGAGLYDMVVHPSADIYTAVVAPELGSLTPEPVVWTVTDDNT